MRPLSKQKKKDIKTLFENGYSLRKIAKRVNVSVGSVSKVRKTSTTNHLKVSYARPRKLNHQQERNIIRSITSGRTTLQKRLPPRCK